MITSITIENFKGIVDPVTIPIRPITLLFGKNSAGKSSILQAMHYAREILQHRNPDPDKTALGGDTIDLGGFANLVHGHDRNKQVRLSFDLELDEFGLSPFPLASNITEHLYGLDEESDALSSARSISVQLETAWKDDSARIVSYGVGIDSKPFAKLEMVGPSACITEFNDEHPIFEKKNDDDENTLCHFALEYWQGESDSSGWLLIDSMKSCIPDFTGPIIFPAEVDSSSSTTSKTGKQGYPAEDTERLNVLFWIFMSRVLVRSGQCLLSELKQMRYLGPIRNVPPRGYHSPKTADESRWANGFGAWDALLRNPVVPSAHILPATFGKEDNTTLVEQVSYYMQNVLGLGYSIRRDERIQLESDSELMAELRLLGIQYDEKDKEYFNQRILKPLESLPTQVVIQLHDEQQDIDVDPADIGVGVSQVLPVVVGALDPGSDIGGCGVFVVEQPELHVHPAVQVALGDVFIDAAKGTNRTMLIETHSEHLLLRLLRRVREGDGSEAAHDKMQRDFTSADLSVVYVKPTPDGVELTPLPVTEDGEFTTPWPEGFFEERAEEVF